MQLNQGEKGFSFSRDGPLDMRMNPQTELTAAEIVNHWSEKKLGELFKDYGEDPRWHRAAKAIVESRKKGKIETTGQLAEVLSAAMGRFKGKLHPATLIFQALRIFVNNELERIETGIAKAIDYLAPGGRIGVISFHSLEDRIVKNIFKVRSFVSKKDKGTLPQIKLLTKKPLIPSEKEMRSNPRARSAKMRFAEKF